MLHDVRQNSSSHILSEKVWLQSFRNGFASLPIVRVNPPAFKII